MVVQRHYGQALHEFSWANVSNVSALTAYHCFHHSALDPLRLGMIANWNTAAAHLVCQPRDFHACAFDGGNEQRPPPSNAYMLRALGTSSIPLMSHKLQVSYSAAGNKQILHFSMIPHASLAVFFPQRAHSEPSTSHIRTYRGHDSSCHLSYFRCWQIQSTLICKTL